MSNTVISIFIVGGVIILLLTFFVGFLFGYGMKKARELIDELRQENEERRVIEETESGIADSSPQHLRAKREERYRRGEPLEDEDSQIVNTKTVAQRQAEANAAKEKKLDKWMPGVKRGR